MYFADISMTYLKQRSANGAHSEGTPTIVYYPPGARLAIILHFMKFCQSQVSFEVIIDIIDELHEIIFDIQDDILYTHDLILSICKDAMMYALSVIVLLTIIKKIVTWYILI